MKKRKTTLDNPKETRRAIRAAVHQAKKAAVHQAKKVDNKPEE